MEILIGIFVLGALVIAAVYVHATYTMPTQQAPERVYTQYSPTQNSLSATHQKARSEARNGLLTNLNLEYAQSIHRQRLETEMKLARIEHENLELNLERQGELNEAARQYQLLAIEMERKERKWLNDNRKAVTEQANKVGLSVEAYLEMAIEALKGDFKHKAALLEIDLETIRKRKFDELDRIHEELQRTQVTLDNVDYQEALRVLESNLEPDERENRLQKIFFRQKHRHAQLGNIADTRQLLQTLEANARDKASAQSGE